MFSDKILKWDAKLLWSKKYVEENGIMPTNIQLLLNTTPEFLLEFEHEPIGAEDVAGGKQSLAKVTFLFALI